MNDENINAYIPSILNPRSVKKRQGELSLTQNSIGSRCSLSLKRKNNCSNIQKVLHKSFPPGKRNAFISNNNLSCAQDDLNSFTRGNAPQNVSLSHTDSYFPLTQGKHNVFAAGKENSSPLKKKKKPKEIDETSIGLTAVEDINTVKDYKEFRSISVDDVLPDSVATEDINVPSYDIIGITDNTLPENSIRVDNNNGSLRKVSSATELEENLDNTLTSTIGYEVTEQQILSVNFGVLNCDVVEVSTKNSHIKNIVITHKDKNIEIDCEIAESTKMSEDVEIIEVSSDEDAPSPPKKPVVSVNLEIKRKTESLADNSKVLILNTDSIERLSHVIVQPPNCKLVKRKISHRRKFKNNDRNKLGQVRHESLVRCESWRQKRIDSYLVRKKVGAKEEGRRIALASVEDVRRDRAGRGDVMSRAPGGVDGERSGGSHKPRETSVSPRAHAPASPTSPRAQQRKLSGAAGSLRESARSQASRNADSSQLHSGKSSNKTPTKLPTKTVPYHKFIAGTHFAVDAFSYGELPNVKYYFLTHFHSDHYSGLKKGFKKILFCSKITADLCTLRLGVSPKCIQVINLDDPITIDGVEVTAVDANHCPGAIMLVFTLASGKTLLHTGDFRASPAMESYPVFWNKNIHTIYLDSTYCNPRYDFPTQEQCLEMALYLLRQKKMALEKVGKKFSSVLIVCGTYTIGKEKFFLGVARRVGCSVWACPEKDKMLKALEGRSFNMQPPASCQLHVVPMRDLTHEKLRSYLDSMSEAFSEVVAFKPSGWENGKNSTVEKDLVTIHGIPYSEHSSFSEMIRFVKFLQPQQVVPTVDISGGVKAVQKYFPCPLVVKEGAGSQSKVTDYFSIQNRQHVPAVT